MNKIYKRTVKKVVPISARRKISRRKPGQKTVNYFNADTQNSIVNYQKEIDSELKKKIYVTGILPAFDSLVENLINVYGFTVMYETKTDLKNECLEFLYNAVGKFNPEKGSKAFSYFNVVAKNWLTIKSKQNAKKIQTYISLDNKDDISKEDLEIIETFKIMPSYDETLTVAEQHEQLIRLLEAIKTRAKTENELICINAIKVILDTIEDIDLLSKRAILTYLKEMTGLPPKTLSLVLSAIRKSYKELKKNQEFL